MCSGELAIGEANLDFSALSQVMCLRVESEKLWTGGVHSDVRCYLCRFLSAAHFCEIWACANLQDAAGKNV